MLNENPPKLNVGEYTMHVPDAPSSGPVLALILNIVDGEQCCRGLVRAVVQIHNMIPHPGLLLGNSSASVRTSGLIVTKEVREHYERFVMISSG